MVLYTQIHSLLHFTNGGIISYITDSEHAEEMSPKTLESLETPKFMGDQNKYWSLWEAYYGYLGIVSNCKAKQIESEG